MIIKKYRVVKDKYCGYEVQSWRIWFPFWLQCMGEGYISNSHSTLEEAKEFISRKKVGGAVYSDH